MLDEADRLLDPTFETELRYIVAALPAERQTLLFSATMTRSLIALQSSALQDAHCFQASCSIGATLCACLGRMYTASMQGEYAYCMI